jgi:hypothetical protein
MIMVSIKHGALAFALAVAVASPVLAKPGARQAGYDARAQAIGGDSSAIRMDGDRAAAIRECNDKAAPLRDYTWGMTQSDSYRACMAGYGQPE